MDSSNLSRVSDHYARTNLIGAIEAGLAQLGKSPANVTIDDLAPVDEFHIGGRSATEEIMSQLHPSPSDHLLDIGCGLGGPARFAASRYGCRVTGADLTRDYVVTGTALCAWVGLERLVSLHHANALSLPFADGTFDAAYMLHVGMNVEDKVGICSEAARVLRPGAVFAVYDVMRSNDGELAFPLPWATTPESNAVAEPDRYRDALCSAGFEIVSERNRREFALAYFGRMQSRLSSTDGPAPLGLHTLMGERRRDQVRNMLENISNGSIAPYELIARKV